MALTTAEAVEAYNEGTENDGPQTRFGAALDRVVKAATVEARKDLWAEIKEPLAVLEQAVVDYADGGGIEPETEQAIAALEAIRRKVEGGV